MVTRMLAACTRRMSRRTHLGRIRAERKTRLFLSTYSTPTGRSGFGAQEKDQAVLAELRAQRSVRPSDELSVANGDRPAVGQVARRTTSRIRAGSAT